MHNYVTNNINIDEFCDKINNNNVVDIKWHLFFKNNYGVRIWTNKQLSNSKSKLLNVDVLKYNVDSNNYVKDGTTYTLTVPLLNKYLKKIESYPEITGLDWQRKYN